MTELRHGPMDAPISTEIWGCSFSTRPPMLALAIRAVSVKVAELGKQSGLIWLTQSVCNIV